MGKIKLGDLINILDVSINGISFVLLRGKSPKAELKTIYEKYYSCVDDFYNDTEIKEYFNCNVKKVSVRFYSVQFTLENEIDEAMKKYCDYAEKNN